MLEDAEDVAIANGITNFSELNPRRLKHILKLKEENNIEKVNNQLFVAWVSGRLNSIAIVSPKDYPKKPIQIGEAKKEIRKISKEEQLRAWAQYCARHSVD